MQLSLLVESIVFDHCDPNAVSMSSDQPAYTTMPTPTSKSSARTETVTSESKSRPTPSHIDIKLESHAPTPAPTSEELGPGAPPSDHLAIGPFIGSAIIAAVSACIAAFIAVMVPVMVLRYCPCACEGLRLVSSLQRGCQ